MAKKWIALNILLLLAAFVLGRELYRQYEQFKTENDLAKTEQASVENQATVKTASDASVDASMEMPAQRDGDFSIISARTLFSDTRGVDENEESVAAQLVPPLNPRPVLVGTIMIDGEYTASVIDPATQQARSGQTNPEARRVGDSYRGYEITGIEPEQMVLENGGRREVIPLNRTARRAQTARPVTAAGATRVIPIGPAGGKGGGITVITASSAALGRVGQTPPPPQNTAKPAQNAAQQTQNAAQTAAGAKQAPQNQRTTAGSTTLNEDLFGIAPENAQPAVQGQQTNQAAKPAQKPQPGADTQNAPDSRQQRIIRSPFGDIIRPGLE